MTLQKRSLSPLSWVLILSGTFFAVFLLISGMLFLSKGSSGSSAALFAGDSVGVIEIKGPIMDSRKALSKLEQFEDSDQIRAVVLRLNSPGGAVAPSQEIYEAVRNYKKPLVVSMGSVAASGAYYIACGAKKVFANPGTITGSIGVIMEFANLKRLYDWAKIQRFSIKTGKFKNSGAEYKDMTEEERALLQGMVDDVLVQFKQAVSTGRKLSLAEVTKIADGRVFSGSQAFKAHLVDELGTLNDAVLAAAKLGKLKGKPNVIYADKQKHGLLDFLKEEPMDGSESSHGAVGSLAQLFRLLTGLKEGPSESLDFTPGVYWIWGGMRSNG